MVFMGNGRAKESKDAITGGLGHIAFVTMHSLHHELQGGIKEATGVLGIEVFDEIHRAFDVGKKSGDGLALTLNRAARLHSSLLGPDMFGEVFGGITHGCRVPRAHSSVWGLPGAAFASGSPGPLLAWGYLPSRGWRMSEEGRATFR